MSTQWNNSHLLLGNMFVALCFLQPLEKTSDVNVTNQYRSIFVVHEKVV